MEVITVDKDILDYLHAPLDNYVFDIAVRELNIKRLKNAWSRWDGYQGQYMSYQNELRKEIRGKNVLRWEFEFWLKEARNRQGTRYEKNLLSFQPYWAEKIMQGTKIFEYRKRFCDEPVIAYMYVSTPVQPTTSISLKELLNNVKGLCKWFIK